MKSQAPSNEAEGTATSPSGATAAQEGQPGNTVSVKTVPGTGCVVTSYATVSESVAPNGVKVTLHSRDVWARFYKSTTEMIITNAGRRTFPVVKISVSNLEPDAKYMIFMDIVLADDNEYKFQDSEWVVTGRAEPVPERLYIHPDSHSSAAGAVWEKQIISFQKLKITDNHLDQLGNIILNSKHKYQSRIHVVKASDESQLSTYQGSQDCSSSSTRVFEETQFIAVTAYQHQQMRQLKIEYNPFAKGYQGWEQACSRQSGFPSSPPPTNSSMASSEHYVLPVAEVGGVSHVMPGPLQPSPILYPPNTFALAHWPTTLAGRHSTAHPGPVHQLPSSTTGTPVSGTLPQLTQHYGQSMLFPHVASTQTPQSTYHPSSAFQPRQALQHTAVLQPVPANLTPRGSPPTVGYMSPVSTSQQRHQAYSQFQPTSERLPNPQAAFSPKDSFPPVPQ